MEKEILNHISELKKNISIINLDKLEGDWKTDGRSKELYSLALIRFNIKKIRAILQKNNEYNLLNVLDKIEKNFEDKKINIVLHDLEKLETFGKTIENNTIEFNLEFNLPKEIKEDVESDLKELEICFYNKCYHSSVILCGRILETALNRKYNGLTNKDSLEKNQNLGLSKIVEKLKEIDIETTSILNEQQDLINKIKLFSVNKKPLTFTIDSEETYKIILISLDILAKLFKDENEM